MLSKNSVEVKLSHCWGWGFDNNDLSDNTMSLFKLLIESNQESTPFRAFKLQFS